MPRLTSLRKHLEAARKKRNGRRTGPPRQSGQRIGIVGRLHRHGSRLADEWPVGWADLRSASDKLNGAAPFRSLARWIAGCCYTISMHSGPSSSARSASLPADPIDASALRISDSADRVGMVGSVLCAIHCATVPLVVSALPALGLGVFASADLDQGFGLFATLLGFSTLLLGYRRHRAFRALALLIPGLTLILIGSFSPSTTIWPSTPC